MNTSSAMADAETLLADPGSTSLLRDQSVELPSVVLDDTALCDLELLLNRGYFPLCGYATRAEHDAILAGMGLPDGTFWPIPITLSVPREAARELSPGGRVCLRDREGFLLAVLDISEIWEPDHGALARAVYGTDQPGRHPAVDRLVETRDVMCLAGRVQGVSLPQRYDFPHLRLTPAESRRFFADHGWNTVMGYQDAHPLHAMHREMLLAAAAEHGARLFLSPLTPPAPFTEVAPFSTVRCYELFLRHMPPDTARLVLTPLYARQAGPRGAMLQALVNRRYGCTHFLVHEGHDDPFPGDTPFSPPHAALEALEAVRERLGIVPVPVRPRRYVPIFSLYLEPREIKAGIASQEVGQADLERRLARGQEVPEWYTFPDILRELRRMRPEASQLGFTLFLTGLSGAGKSTLAKVLSVMLQECQHRPVSLLDGDIVRRHLSSELTFSREHRNLNVQRIGYVASEITKNRGIALCAPIAPYPESRRRAREMVAAYGPFIEIHVSTPLEVCERRDRKGLYAKARAGVICGVTGVDDPYLPPENPELRIDTTFLSPREAAEIVLDYLRKRGLLPDSQRKAP